MRNLLYSCFHWCTDVLSNALGLFKERRFTLRTATAMLILYRQNDARLPLQPRSELFIKVICGHVGCGREDAVKLMNDARTSYASWPVQRDLTFCDIVHYVSFLEFTKVQGLGAWMNTDLTPLIAASVPHKVCAQAAKQGTHSLG